MQNVQITLETLFQTLGLASDEKDMDLFVDHHQLDAGVKLENAPFWNDEQRQILANYKSTNEEWVIIIDLLDELLHGE
ncbi:DUF2789 family protein [Acinetobacter faecalis]|uniref:DUF2789 family protein n=1 Tax=Acinetobacter faecalis TaxID=2665161 RepID=UPI002A91E183|nr:DUF2789 family protein [Acinetobacter faecalis]MDY6449222.1 DUF2789 family protein [Acinetobacter faecalis]MDY6457877.1 DUF2789 family protein [Acinetobacter faecalis]